MTVIPVSVSHVEAKVGGKVELEADGKVKAEVELVRPRILSRNRPLAWTPPLADRI